MNNYDLGPVAGYYDALFLDNDGTCAQTEELHAKVGTEILNEAGVDITYQERLSFMGMGEYAIWDHLNSQGRTPSISKEEFKTRQSVRFIEALNAMPDPNVLARPGVDRLVHAFRAANKPVIVVSNTPRDIVDTIQKMILLSAYVHHVIAFDDMMANHLKAKPAPDGYEWAKKIARSIRPEETGRYLAVEDAHKGWLAAHRAQCETIHIYYDSIGQTANPEATFTVADHQDLCAAFTPMAKGGSPGNSTSFPQQPHPLLKGGFDYV